MDSSDAVLGSFATRGGLDPRRAPGAAGHAQADPGRPDQRQRVRAPVRARRCKKLIPGAKATGPGPASAAAALPADGRPRSRTRSGRSPRRCASPVTDLRADRAGPRRRPRPPLEARLHPAQPGPQRPRLQPARGQTRASSSTSPGSTTTLNALYTAPGRLRPDAPRHGAGELRHRPDSPRARSSPSPTCDILLPAHRPATARQHPGMHADGTARTDTRSDRRRGGLRLLVLRPAALPLDHLRRPGPAEARGLPDQGPVQRGDPARSGVRRAHLQRLGRQGQVDRAWRTPGPTGTWRWRRSRSTARTRRSPPTRGRCSGRRRCSARPTSSSPRGTANGPKLPEGGTLPKAQVEPSVQLDEIFRTFDAQDPGRVPDLDAAARRSPAHGPRGGPLGRDRQPRAVRRRTRTSVLRVLDTQQGAVQQLVRNTGVVFGALSERQGQLQGLIRNCGHGLPTTARAQPGPRGHLPGAADLPRRVEADAQPARELLAQRQPADHPAPSLGAPAERRTSSRWPRSRLTSAASSSASARSSSAPTPRSPHFAPCSATTCRRCSTTLQPFLRQLTPIVAGALRYDQDITAFLGNATAAFQGANSTAESNRSAGPLPAARPACSRRRPSPCSPRTV